MTKRYERAAFDAFTCADVLRNFGLDPARRRPCPFCGTSDTSQAFVHGGAMKACLFYCHACGERGDSVKLYAFLAGVSPGRAIAEIACHLGLAESDPGEWDRKRAEREARAEIERAERQAESWRLTRLAVAGFEAERESEWLKGLAYRLKDRNALGLAYEADGRAMVLDYQLGNA